jgi:hypothetical protein
MIRPFLALPRWCGAWLTRSALEPRSLWLGGRSGTIPGSIEIKEAGIMLGSAGLFFGIASLVFGIVVMVFPKILNYLVGIYFIVLGVILILVR